MSTLTKDHDSENVLEYRTVTTCRRPLTDVSEREGEYERPSELKRPIAGFVILEENPTPGKKNGSR
jgi:hypothetical protein